MRHALSTGALALALTLAAGGCAGPGTAPLPAAATEAEVLQQWGPPTGRYTLPGGVTRLEYATGPYGRQTWMVDLDASGRVTERRQVLDEGYLQQVQGQLPGMTRRELLQTLGRPAQVRPGGWQGGQVWSWRHETRWCLWFQVSVGDDGIVRDGAFGPDPACDDDESPIDRL